MANKNDFEDDEIKIDNKVMSWIAEIEASKKREKDYNKDGKEILAIYSGEKKADTPFNILYSNTETLLPALYSSTPRPVVQRRFKDDSILGRASAKAGERVLEFLLDTNIDGYDTYDDCVKSATLDGLLPGRGVTTVKYDAKISTVGEGDESYEQKSSELVCTEIRSWDKVFFGYAKKWSKMPWIAYEEYIDKDEATRLFGKDVALKLQYTTKEQEKEDDDRDDDDSGELAKAHAFIRFGTKKQKKLFSLAQTTMKAT